MVAHVLPLRVEALLAEARGWAGSALYVEQVGREPFTQAEWQLLEMGSALAGRRCSTSSENADEVTSVTLYPS
jgi:hypothetical protein